jgi:CRP-like cAMP-binding protein
VRRVKGTEPERRNSLLATLSRADLRHLASLADTVDLNFGQVLYEPGEPKQYVYFPTSAYISQIASLSGVPRMEVGLVGAEGMIGSSLLFGVDAAPFHTVVRGAGSALRLGSIRFLRELAEGAALRAVMNRYLYVRLSQLGQMAACARFHTVAERLARWLLMTRDRAQSDRFHMTHQYIAYMLGVRRVGITEAATLLQKRNLIQYTRGELAIIAGPELEATACECYAAAERIYRQNMSR